MKRCPKCSYPNPDDRGACFKCSTPLDVPAPSPDPAPAPAPAPTPVPTPTVVGQQLDPSVCPECGGIPEQGDYIVPLCTACRDKMASRPLPAWTIASIAVVGLILVFAFARFPAALQTGIAYERGLMAEDAGDYQFAKQQYTLVTKQYPDSTLALARLAISQCRTTDAAGAEATLQKLEGREANQELANELDRAVTELEIRLISESRPVPRQ